MRQQKLIQREIKLAQRAESLYEKIINIYNINIIYIRRNITNINYKPYTGFLKTLYRV